MENNHIKPAVVQDIPALVQLVNSAYRGETSRQGWTSEADLLDGIRTSENQLREMMQHPQAVILKYTDEQEQIIGCVFLEKRAHQMYLGMLTVQPALQARGIGKQLMIAAEALAKARGCSSIIMSVISDRRELISWYERRGYRLTGERLPFPMDDPNFGIPKKHLEFVMMEKMLTA